LRRDHASRNGAARVRESRGNCVFCRIVRGEAPAQRLDENGHTVTIMDAFPASPGHVLVLTREHYEDIHEIPEDALCAVAAQSKRVAAAVVEVLSPDGVGIYQLNGTAAGQTIPHYHMHVIPRTMGQERKVHGRAPADGATQDELAARLRAALES
jgi:histidine triad (HIT) family protein